MSKKKYWLTLSVVIIVLMIGCYLLGSSTNDNENSDDSSSTESSVSNPSPSSYTSQGSQDSYAKSTDQVPTSDNIAGKKQQMVYHADIRVQVAKLQSARDELDQIAKQTRASMVSSSEAERLDERYIRITYNVPQVQFQAFLDHSKKISDIAPDIQIQGDDVSEELVDLQARIKAKQAMEARLLAMMNKATTTSDLLNVEGTLGSVQEQLEQLTGRQQYLQHRVAFSTITIEISSVAYQPLQSKLSFVNQLSQGFIDSCKDLWTGLQLFIIWLAKALPYLILLGIIAVTITLYIKKRKKKSANNHNV